VNTLFAALFPEDNFSHCLLECMIDTKRNSSFVSQAERRIDSISLARSNSPFLPFLKQA